MSTHEFARPAREELERELASLARLLDLYLPELPENADEVFRQALACAALSCHLGELERGRVLLDQALDGALASFALACASGAVAVEIAGRRVSYPATGPSEAANASTWVEALCLALTLRRRAAVEALFGVDLRTIAAAPVGVARHRLALVGTFAAVVDGRHAAEAVDEQRAHMRAEGMASPHDMILAAFVDGLGAVATGDAAALDAALQALVEAHRRYWGSARWRKIPRGLISVLGLGLASLAVDRGLAVTIDSGYMPRRLYTDEGPWPAA